MRNPFLMSSNSLLFYVSFLTNWKWDFCLQWREKNVLPHSLCKLPVGYDKPWTHHWLRLHLCGMMQMMTHSFIPHHVCAANRCNTQGWARVGTWLRGWAAWLNHSEVACYQTAVRPLSQRSPLAGASVHLHSKAALTSLCFSVCDDGNTLFQFVTGWVCQCHSDLTHVNVWQRTVHLIFIWLEDSLMEEVIFMSPTPKYHFNIPIISLHGLKECLHY